MTSLWVISTKERTYAMAKTNSPAGIKALMKGLEGTVAKLRSLRDTPGITPDQSTLISCAVMALMEVQVKVLTATPTAPDVTVATPMTPAAEPAKLQEPQIAPIAPPVKTTGKIVGYRTVLSVAGFASYEAIYA